MRLPSIVALCLLPGMAMADDGLQVPAVVLGVTDGDSFRVRAHVWPGTFVETTIRIDGIDTPERSWRAKCDAERDLAEQAAAALAELLTGGRVLLEDIRPDKYGGRHLAAVHVGTVDVAAALIGQGLAVAYYGEGPRRDWCPAPVPAERPR